MKKYLKCIFIVIFALFLWNMGNTVQANSISKISMDISIDDNGDASVTETWVCSATEGTEVYHPYYNLGNSRITGLTVSENGTNYQTLSYWYTSGSLSSKAYKCGINSINNGVELCWGISKYGSHTYTVKYNISNFVSELTDSQMVYWTLIPHNFSNTIGSVYIKIYSNFKYSNSLDVWGYGDYGAPTYVYNGFIEMQSNGKLKSNEYMTILVKFPPGSFKTTNRLNHNFEYYYNMAEGGTTKSYKINFLFILATILLTITTFIIIPTTIFANKILNNISSLFNKIPKDIKTTRNSIKKVKKADYYREVPCDNDLFRAYYIAYQYGIIKKETDILGAVILKWIKDSWVRIEKRESSGILKKDEDVLILNEIRAGQIYDEYEQRIFMMLKSASKDGILEKNELKDWCRSHYKNLLSWFETILNKQREILVREGYITVNPKSEKGFFKNVYKKYIETPLMIQEAEKIAGLKKFLLDYTLINKREAIEVKLFEEYLVYAQMLGIAKKVAKQFKDLYPEVIEQSNFNNYDNIIFINYCSTVGIKSAQNAKSAAEARASSYSSGGGGFSSGGGGGGSFGSGSRGGGGFR